MENARLTRLFTELAASPITFKAMLLVLLVLLAVVSIVFPKKAWLIVLELEMVKWISWKKSLRANNVLVSP